MITINIGEIKTEKIVLSGSNNLVREKHQIKTREYEHKRHKCVLERARIISFASEFE